jgi:hypothetical protein
LINLTGIQQQQAFAWVLRGKKEKASIFLITIHFTFHHFRIFTIFDRPEHVIYQELWTTS